MEVLLHGSPRPPRPKLQNNAGRTKKSNSVELTSPGGKTAVTVALHSLNGGKGADGVDYSADEGRSRLGAW